MLEKAYRMRGFILRVRKHFSNPNTFISLYFSLVRSQLEYAAVCWSPFYLLYIDRIEGIQRKFISILHWKYPNFSIRLSTLQNRRILLDLSFLYKIINHYIDSPVLLNRFAFRVPSHSTRTLDLFALEIFNTNYAMNSPVHRLALTFNNMSSIPNSPDIFKCSLLSFKTFLKYRYFCNLDCN